MKLTSPSNVRTILAELGIAPSKARGQNFLIDRNILEIVVSTARISATDGVLEVGAGLGVLTEELVARARHVTAVEIDHRLCDYLRGRFAGSGRLELICDDVLKLDMVRLLDGVDKVVANLPYSVASRVLVELAEAANPPTVIVATVQLEVAKRLAAVPGDENYGGLTIWVQSAYDVVIRKVISSSCFWPVPEVESAVVRMEKRDDRIRDLKDRRVFHLLVKHAFMQRRKQMLNILGHLPGHPDRTAAGWRTLLEGLGIDPAIRPENLSVKDWFRLANALTSDK